MTAAPGEPSRQPDGEPGGRRFARVTSEDGPGLTLEAGGSIPGLTIAYETWGTPDPDRSNAVLVLHALTLDSHAIGPAGPGHPTRDGGTG